MSLPVTERRRRRSGGNTLVETVFTILPTFALIFGFVDFGLVIFRWSTLQNAVREGCRYAITFQTKNAGTGQDASIREVVERNAFNMVKVTDNPQHIVINYYSPLDLNNPIPVGGNLPGNVVEVSVRNISWQWLAPLSGGFGGNIPMLSTANPINLNVFSSDILGGYPAGVTNVAR